MKVKIATINTLAALASILQDDLDKHIQIVIPMLEVAAAEKESFEPFMDALQIMGTLFKSCRHGSGRNFINSTEQLT